MTAQAFIQPLRARETRNGSAPQSLPRGTRRPMCGAVRGVLQPCPLQSRERPQRNRRSQHTEVRPCTVGGGRSGRRSGSARPPLCCVGRLSRRGSGGREKTPDFDHLIFIALVAPQNFFSSVVELFRRHQLHLRVRAHSDAGSETRARRESRHAASAPVSTLHGQLAADGAVVPRARTPSEVPCRQAEGFGGLGAVFSWRLGVISKRS